MDLLVDPMDPEQTVAIIRGVTKGRLRFALDTVGKESAERLQQCLSQGQDGKQSHLVGLTGLPKCPAPNVTHHKVRIKGFHSIQVIGERLMTWLERLLLAGRLTAPEIEVAARGFNGINKALDTLREGSVSGKRVTVPLNEATLV